MTETRNGKQVLALLAQDEPPEIEYFMHGKWIPFNESLWTVWTLRTTPTNFRIKPTPPRRLSVTLANGEAVSWPEPVREPLEHGQEYWYFDYDGEDMGSLWEGVREDRTRLAFGNIHLTREAAQEHADALRKINCQEVGKC